MSKEEDAHHGARDASGGHDGRPSRTSVGRLSLYLRRLESFLRQGILKVSSSQLGEALGVTDAQVRKDLAHLGHLGQPGIGYPVRELVEAIRRVLGIDRDWTVVLVGVGNLARRCCAIAAFSSAASALWRCSTPIRRRSARWWTG